jgi:hypothetical protein
VIDVVASYFVPKRICGFKYQFVNQSSGAQRYHWDFGVVDTKIYTTDRRFKKKGLFYMTKMMIFSVLNSNNPKFFQHHHNYWK